MTKSLRYLVNVNSDVSNSVVLSDSVVKSRDVTSVDTIERDVSKVVTCAIFVTAALPVSVTLV